MSTPGAGPSNVSSSSWLELKALTAEHKDRFDKEGRGATRGQARNKPVSKVGPATRVTAPSSHQAKDPFARPSPGLVKRLAAEARSDAKRRVFQDEPGGPSDEQRRDIMLAKAKKYEALKRGDLSGLTEREIAESVIDFERKAEEEWSDHSSDEDESAQLPKALRYDPEEEQADDDERIEYIDEMGRTRMGTRRDAREAEKARRRDERHHDAPLAEEPDQSSYAEVMNSKVIHGDQNFFPVYEPDPDAIREKYREAEEASRAHHYDSTKEVRTKGAGQYQFSLDEEKRAEQMASLKAQRQETETARQEVQKRGGMSKAQEAHKRKLDERRALIEAKRVKLFGGQEELDRLRKEKNEREAEAFLQGLEKELQPQTGARAGGAEVDAGEPTSTETAPPAS